MSLIHPIRNGQASVAVNSLGLLDLLEIAAEGLAPMAQYQVYLAEANQPLSENFSCWRC
jgi:hypothetical protein